MLLSTLSIFAQEKAIKDFTGCGTDLLMINSKDLTKLQNKFNDDLYKTKITGNTFREAAAIATIPVVVHIIHNGGPENISDAQVLTAIANFNSKFAESNNYQIQFCLAQRDPLGNSTNGITRNQSALTNETMETEDISLKDINRWDPHCYMNIWIVKSINSQSMGNGVIGYAYFPSAHGQPMDGIVIEADYFGTSAENDAVGAHEIGHYLGLYHTFENGCGNSNCLIDGDQVCDTPPDQTTFSSCSPNANSCSSDADDTSPNNPFNTDVADLGNDYMDYSSLSCYNMFTAGQYSRMEYFLTTTRNSLLNCLSCMSPCPTPITAVITSPAVNPTSTAVGTSINFSATANNTTNYQWYINPSSTLSTSLNFTYTFNTPGIYWVKFKAISTNPALCLNGIDSVKIIVTQAAVLSCAGSVLFDNNNIGAELPNSTNYCPSTNGGYTWECWFKLNAPIGATMRPLISGVDAVTFEDMYLGFGWTGGFYNEPISNLVFKTDGPNSTFPSGPNSAYAPPGGFIVGTWYHAAGVMNYVTHTTKLYVNGSLVNTQTNNNVPNPRNITTYLSYLWAGDPTSLQGNMDEVRIWSKPLTDAEIQTNYNTCLNGNEPNLLAYFRCNQSQGSQVLDATSNNLDAIIYTTPSWSTQEPTLIGTSCVAACIEICGNGIDDNNNGEIDEGCSCPELTASNDTIKCNGIGVQLNSSSGFTNYLWSPTTGLSNANIQNPIANPSTTTNYTLTGSTPGINLVVNPDFSGGNVGFTSGHTYTISYAPCNYYVGSDFFTLVDPTLTDHTASADNMMMTFDGCTTGPTNLWTQTINGLAPNTNYQFSFWASRSDVAQPNFEIDFNANVTGNQIMANLPGIVYQGVWTWDQYLSPVWNSGSNTSLSITIKNLAIDGMGNDFGLDDISFSKVCSDTETVRVLVPTVVPGPLELGNNISLCTTGTHTFNAGNGYATYLWNDGSNSPTLTVFGPGKYWVTVTDSCGNVRADTVRITQTNNTSINLNDTTFCQNSIATINYANNFNFSNFSWTPTTGLSCYTCQYPTVTGTTSQTYTLVATNSNGCSSMDSMEISFSNVVITDYSSELSCNQFNTDLVINSIVGGISPFEYSLNHADYTFSNTFYNLIPGIYIIQIKGRNNCVFTDTLNIFELTEGPKELLYTTKEVTCTNNGEIKITQVVGGTAPYMYSLNNGPYQTSNEYLQLSIGGYTIAIKDSLNCAYKDSIYLDGTLYDDLIYIPNAFTPNTDIYNAVWQPKGECISEIHGTIFNRWGEEIAHINSMEEFWNGTYKGNLVEDGVYAYLLDITYVTTNTERRHGTITLIK